jgi:hypothetical protein
VGAGDLCPRTPDPDQRDRDGDGIGDACDDDADDDGLRDAVDPCPLAWSPPPVPGVPAVRNPSCLLPAEDEPTGAPPPRVVPLPHWTFLLLPAALLVLGLRLGRLRL